MYANETNSFQTFFGDQASRLLKFKYGKHDLALGLENGTTEKLEATVDKNNISYSNILPHGKVDYQITNSSIKEKIILEKLPESNVFTFHITANDLTAKKEKERVHLFP